MATDHRPRRRRLPLRIRVALAGLAGLGAAWLIPRAGIGPSTAPTPAPTRPTTLTAYEEPLATVSEGVSFQAIDGVRVFTVRSGTNVLAFVGVATTPGVEPIHWCTPNHRFESDASHAFYGADGVVLRYSAPRDLDRLSVISAGGRVTIFPHHVIRGGPAPPAPATPPPLPSPMPCAANERVG